MYMFVSVCTCSPNYVLLNHDANHSKGFHSWIWLNNVVFESYGEKKSFFLHVAELY